MRTRIRRPLALLLASALLTLGAMAESLALPGQLTAIEAEAFAGDSSIREAAIPETVQSIGDRAFAGCENLNRIAISAATDELGEDFLQGCGEEILIQTEADSAAHRYALSHQIDYQAGTSYRALLIGQTYEDSPVIPTLKGPKTDVRSVRSCLALYAGTPYQVVTRLDLTAEGIKSAIRESFGGAKPQDVSLLYYSGHGVMSDEPQEQGALLGTDVQPVTADELRGVLDEIPGRKIVIVDACYSGNLISPETASIAMDGAAPKMSAAEFADSFAAAFGRKSRANLAADSYFVITAAAADEESYEVYYASMDQSFGAFTTLLVEGCGYDAIGKKTVKKHADGNKSGDISIQEAYAYVYPQLVSQGMYSQHVQVYPKDCKWFGFLRK